MSSSFHKPPASRLGGFFILLISLLFLSQCKKAASTPTWSSPPADSSVTASPATEATPPALSDLPPPDPSAPPVHFLAYNLRNYLSMPRRVGTESRMLPKPPHEIQALIKHITAAKPDILGICEIGTQADLNDLKKRLASAGLTYPYHHLTGGNDPYRRLAILSRFPLTAHPQPNIHYRMNGYSYISSRGILDVTIQLPAGPVRFLGAHLKSKRPVPDLDQALVRRNEAMVLRRHIDQIFTKSPHTALLVYGDLNDTKQSAAIRCIAGQRHTPTSLKDIQLKASDRSNWTHHWAHEDIYSRIDFIFASRALIPRINITASKLLDTAADDPASDHRGLFVEIR